MSCYVLSRFDFYPTASLSEPPEIEFSKNLKWRGHYHNEETIAIQGMKCREQFYGFPPLATFFLSKLSLLLFLALQVGDPFLHPFGRGRSFQEMVKELL